MNTIPSPSPSTWRLEDYDFDLPEERIAAQPLEPRDQARLLHISKSKDTDFLSDQHVYDLPSLLKSGDVLVLNNTKVIPARLYGLRDAVKIEILLHKRIHQGVWQVLARPGKRLRVNDTLVFTPRTETTTKLCAVVREKLPQGDVILDFSCDDATLFAALDLFGHMPLPPYIKRPEGDTIQDKTQYQTVYAEREGAVAAPTAGLHFTPELLQALQAKGVTLETVTLHVGAGTFLPVKVDDIRDHQMHAEWGEISQETAARLNTAKAEKRRIIAIGTTALRVLESAATEQGVVEAFSKDTAIFIYPGYRFKFVDALMTNFHLPKSTLFMLVAAFAGLDKMRQAYAHAIQEKYRFYSYGDTSFLE